ncbi:MAG: GyrI-like domain-containing protein [Thermoplasmata archaeon]
METKLDLTKEYKIYYTARTSPVLVEFGEISFLTIKGKGEPGEKEFPSKVEALYSLAYGIKNICKKQAKDFTIPKLEGLWWVESDRPALEVPHKEWQWKLLIRLLDFVSLEMVEKAKEAILKKNGIKSIKKIKFEKIKEGKCIQILHIGPYSIDIES